MTFRRRSGLERVSRDLRPKTTVLIVVEGRRTEPYYLDGLTRETLVNERFAVRIKPGRHSSPDHLVGEAMRLQRDAETRGSPFDEVWCVCDVEGPSRAALLRAALAQAEHERIRLILSNPSFEVWLLAHFLRTHRSFPNVEAVIADLNKHWPGGKYRKSDPKVYEKVAPRTGIAVENARAVREKDHGADKHVMDCNSCTEVYKIVERLAPPEVRPSSRN